MTIIECKVCGNDIKKRFYDRDTSYLCKKCLKEITDVINSIFIYGKFKHSPNKMINDIAYKSFIKFVRKYEIEGGE